MPLARQFYFDDLAAMQQLDAHHRADRMHVLDRCLQAFFARLMGDVDIVRPDEGRCLLG